MQERLLTVLLLTYNQKDYIEKAMDSVLEQKTDFPFTIYVAEDCSTDGTQDLLLRYKERYPNKIDLHLNEKNYGAEKNMHNALLNIKTRYYAFLEGDDRWCDKEKLQMQVNALEKNPDCNMCGHNAYIHNGITGEMKTFLKVPGQRSERRKIKEKYSIEDGFWVHSSTITYRNIVDFKNIPETMMFDASLYLLYLAKGNMYYIDRVMSVYNITGKGMWSGLDKTSKDIFIIKTAYDRARYFDFKYDLFYENHPNDVSNSNLLRFMWMIFGKRAGWSAYFHSKIAMLRLGRNIRMLTNKR